MKKALSLLVAFIFLQTQTWALSGGPVYTATRSNDLTGVYAGAMVAKTLVLRPGSVLPALGSATSTGVFSITVPIAGAATGTTVFFQNGTAYTGTIIGAANPLNSSITGIIQATSTDLFTVSALVPAFVAPPVPPAVVGVLVPAVPAVTTALFATGTMQARVSLRSVNNTGNQAVNGVARSANAAVGGVDASGNPVSTGQNGDRLSGTATILTKIANSTLVGQGPINTASTKYSISGVRQTNVIAAAVPAAP